MKKTLAVISKELGQKKLLIATYSLISFVFLWLYVVMFPSLAQSSVDINQIYKAVPKAVLQAFNIEQIDMSFSGFLASKHLDLMWPLMAIFVSLSLAGNMIAGEIERGSISMLLSLPNSRLKLYVQKYLAGIIAISAFVVLSISTVGPLTAAYDIKVVASHIWMTSMLCWLFAAGVFSFGFAVSAFVREKGRVYMIVGGVLVLMYIARVFSGLFESLENLKYFSAFYYFNPDKSLIDGTVALNTLLFFGVVSIISFALGLFQFVKRDV